MTFHSFATSRQIARAYSPDQIATAYDFTPLYSRGLSGKGQTVALLETDGLRKTDIQQFDQAYGLPSPSIKEYYTGGKRFTTTNGGETELDVEWLHALAPGAAIQIYYLKNNQSSRAGWTSMATALRNAASRGAKIISISMGTCGPSSGYTATSNELATLQRQGVSVFVSSGDSGDHPGPVHDCGNTVDVAYPSGDPSVVSVGGSSLDLNADNTIADESAWNLSGGGQVSEFARAVWQIAANLPADQHRWAPDVAFVGDPQTGVSVYYKNRWHQVGGTSLGAPAWAAIWALIRQSAQGVGVTVGAAPALLYRIGNSTDYAQAFHDITDGSNGQYSAGPGWDPVTGWGTPDVANLATAVQTLSTS